MKSDASLGLAIVAAAFVLPLPIGCQSGQHPSEAPTGTLSLPLSTTSADGATFRLRNARFEIAGRNATVLETETDPTRTILSADLHPGPYTVLLAAGWHMEKFVAGVGTTVVATALTTEPQPAQIRPSATTRVTFRFQVEGHVVTLDSGKLEVAVEVATLCDPVDQTGCPTGAKCTTGLEPPLGTPSAGATICATTGSTTEGNACARGASGLDDCAAGLFCLSGTCARICQLAAPPAGCACTRFAGTFEDQPTVGVCQPSCSLVAQNCAAGAACYLLSGNTLCANVAEANTQNAPCRFANSCAQGYSCLLPHPAGGGMCGFICDASGGGGPSCAAGPGDGFSCRSFAELGIPGPVGLGVCIGTTN